MNRLTCCAVLMFLAACRAQKERPVESPPVAQPQPTGPGAADQEFDRGAAVAALTTAAGVARACKRDDGPTGTARVKLTFAPSGSVTSVSVEGPPFAGTSVGSCIAAAFRSVHVPEFNGPPLAVAKSVTIN